MTGSSRVAKAPPDGYTVLLSGSAVLAINQTLYKKPLYNAVTDFEHVALFSDSARVLITRKDLPVNTLAEFVAYAKANQGKMQYGSAGAGSGMHVCAVLLDAAMGTAAAGARSPSRRERRRRSCGGSPRPSTMRWKRRPCASGSRASA